MKKIIKKIFIPALLINMVLPSIALAETYNLMSGKIPGLSEGTVDTTNPATFIVSLYWYIFGLGVALAVLMIVWGGVGYTLKWSEAMTTDSRGRITNAIIGLVILFTSWLILNTINPALVNFNLNLGEKGCNSPITGNPGGGAYSAAGPVGGGVVRGIWKSSSASYGDEQTVRNKLKELGIEVIGTKTNEPCKTLNQIGCTSVGGLGQNAIDSLEELSAKVPGLKITGGTEIGIHTTHGPDNNNVVDLDDSQTLTKYVMANKAKETSSKGYPLYYMNNGDIYYRESSHYHVIFAGEGVSGSGGSYMSLTPEQEASGNVIPTESPAQSPIIPQETEPVTQPPVESNGGGASGTF